MIVDVGICLQTGIIVINDKDSFKKYYYINPVDWEEIVRVDDIIDFIKSKIHTELGCLCATMNDNFHNKFREKFIESVLNAGFKKVEIISHCTAEYLHAVSETLCLCCKKIASPSYYPNCDDVIWIFNGNEWFIWQKFEYKAEFIAYFDINNIEEETLEKINTEINADPNVIICHEDENLNKVKELFPECKIFFCDFKSALEKGALLKARIMSSDTDVLDYDANNVLDFDVTVYGHDDQQYMHFGKYQNLPIEKTIVIKSYKKLNETTIVSPRYRLNIENRPPVQNFYVEIAINENGIFSCDGNTLPVDAVTAGKEPAITPNEDIDETDVPIYYLFPKNPVIKNESINAVGIDLGTSRCCIAVNRKNGIETVAIENDGGRLMPSYVGYDEKTEKCGQIVVIRLKNHSKSAVFDVKRLIGKPYEYIVKDDNWPFKVIKKHSKTIIEIERFNEKTEVTPEEVSAVLLKQMKIKAEEFQGKILTDVVITVPVAFKESQKIATLKAAQLAGWENIQLLPESVAAAITYFVDKSITEVSTLLIIDLGGGTLDVGIVDMYENHLEIISAIGDAYLGGRDFDNLLFHHFTGVLDGRYNVKLKKDLQKFRLMEECLNIKHNLSVRETDEFSVDVIDPNVDGFIGITRKEFNNLTKKLMLNMKNTIVNALDKSGYTSGDIDIVLLVGGGCRMPMVKEMLQEMFPFAVFSSQKSPEEIVAIGAAYYSYFMQSNKE